MNNPKILPPTYLLSAIIIMVGFHFVFPLMTVVSFPWNLVDIIPPGEQDNENYSGY